MTSRIFKAIPLGLPVALIASIISFISRRYDLESSDTSSPRYRYLWFPLGGKEACKTHVTPLRTLLFILFGSQIEDFFLLLRDCLMSYNNQLCVAYTS